MHMETDLTEQDRTPVFSAAHPWLISLTLAVLLLGVAARSHADPWPFAEQQLFGTLGAVPVNRYPHYAGSAWTVTNAKAWTAGFFPGCLWAMYYQTGDPMWRAEAEAQMAALERQKTRTDTHDLGLMFVPSFVNAYRLTGDTRYRQVALTAAGSLAKRYNAKIGVIETSYPGRTKGQVKTIIDTMMNLELLFWASANGGDPAWARMAHSHALKTAENHVRDDGSTYQMVIYNASTGAVIKRGAVPKGGYSNESTWARGQAWAIYGFATALAYTGDPALFPPAHDTATYWKELMIDPPWGDDVPPWDFGVPNPVTVPRDSSAAAIAASGFVTLASYPDGLRPEPSNYSDDDLSWASATLTTLERDYLTQGTDNPAILDQGAPNGRNNYDKGTIYGDYYFLEALIKLDLARGVTPQSQAMHLTQRSGVHPE
jgi:unsaturated chondroitin disaccharide hydrolase